MIARRNFTIGAAGLLVPKQFSHANGQQSVLASSFADPTTDPYIANVVLLMHSPSSGGFVDATGRHTFTTNGSPAGPTLVTDHTFSTQTKCGKNSRSVSQYLTIAGNLSDFSFGTSDFTIEMLVWGTFTSGSPYNGIFSTAPFATGGSPYGVGFQLRDGLLQALENTASSAPTNICYWSLTGGNASGWNSIAIQRSGGSSMSCYYNGVLKTLNTQSAPQDRSYTNTVTPTLMLQYSDGSYPTIGGAFDGFFTEVRITKGVARYSSNYTPRTTPFPDS